VSKTKSTSTDLEKTISSIKEENEKLFEQMNKQVTANTKIAVELLKQLINESPEIEACRWVQYTPYFNDGEECKFGVHELELKFNPEMFPHNEETEEDDCLDADGFVYEWRLGEFLERGLDVLNVAQVVAVEKKVELFIKIHSELQNMDQCLKNTFGDHVKVVVTRTGIETEEFAHD
jgi:hypothetical protein